jgi:hypothetical protein
LSGRHRRRLRPQSSWRLILFHHSHQALPLEASLSWNSRVSRGGGEAGPHVVLNRKPEGVQIRNLHERNDSQREPLNIDRVIGPAFTINVGTPTHHRPTTGARKSSSAMW